MTAPEPADQTRADVVLSEDERESLWLAMPDDVTGAQESMIYAAVERILADRDAEHAAEVEARKKATGEVDPDRARASMDDLAETADSARATVARVRDALDCPHGTHIYDTDATCRWCGLPSWVEALIRVALER